MLLLIDLTSAPDDKSIGIEYCQKINTTVSPIRISILHMKNIADTYTNTRKVSLIGNTYRPTVILTTLSYTSPQHLQNMHILPSKGRPPTNKIHMPFCSRESDLDLMTFIYELDLDILKIYLQTKNELSSARLSKVTASHTRG